MQASTGSETEVFEKVEEVKDEFSDVDVLFHFAADPEVRTGYDNPEGSFDQNIVNTFKLLQKIKHTKIKKFVFASSSSVYGDVEEKDEDKGEHKNED